MTNKSLQAKFLFYDITKNPNWEILTKNLVTFKRWDGVKDQYRGGLPKTGGGLGQFANWRGGGGLARKRGVVLLQRAGSWYPNAHCEYFKSCFLFC